MGCSNSVGKRRISQAEFLCCSGDATRNPESSAVSSPPSPSCRTRRLGFLCGSLRPSSSRVRRHVSRSISPLSTRTHLRAQGKESLSNEGTGGSKDEDERLFQSMVNGTTEKLVKNLNGSEVFLLRQTEDKDLGRRHFGFVRWLEESAIISFVNRISESCGAVVPRVVPWRVRGVRGGLFHAFRDPQSVDNRTELPVAIDPISVDISNFQSRAFAVSRVYLEIHNLTVNPRAISRFRRRALLETWKQFGNGTGLWPVEDGPITDKSLLEEEIFGGPFNVNLAAFVTPSDIQRSPWFRIKVQQLLIRMLDKTGLNEYVTANVTGLTIEENRFVARADIYDVGAFKRSTEVSFRVNDTHSKGDQDVFRVIDLKPGGLKFEKTDISVGIGRHTKADLHYTNNGLLVLAKLKLAVPNPRLLRGDGRNFEFDIAYLYSAFLRKRINGVFSAGPRAPDEIVGDDFDERSLTKVKAGGG